MRDELLELLSRYPDITDESFDLDEWLAGPNKVYQAGPDYGMFTKLGDGAYEGHYVFTSRWKEALASAKDILRQAFDDDALLILGAVPEWNKPSVWITRKLGFSFVSVIDINIDDEPYHLFIMTKADFNG